MATAKLQHPASAAHALALAAERRREAKVLQRQATQLPPGNIRAGRLFQRAERALDAAEHYLEVSKGEFAPPQEEFSAGLLGPALIATL